MFPPRVASLKTSGERVLSSCRPMLHVRQHHADFCMMGKRLTDGGLHFVFGKLRREDEGRKMYLGNVIIIYLLSFKSSGSLSYQWKPSSSTLFATVALGLIPVTCDTGNISVFPTTLLLVWVTVELRLKAARQLQFKCASRRDFSPHRRQQEINITTYGRFIPATNN